MKSSLLFMLPILVFIALGNCGILGGEDKEPPIVWEEESLEGLVVYGFTSGGNILHMVNLENDAILNIHGINNINSVAASADGSKLFVSSGEGLYGGDPGYVTIIDTKTWKGEVIYDHSVEFISAGEEIYFITKLDYLASNNGQLDLRSLGKIDSNMGGITEIDVIDVVAAGHNDFKIIEYNSREQIIFALNSNRNLYKYEIETNTSNKLFDSIDFSQHSIFEVSEDANTLYFSGGPVLDVKENKQIGQIQVFKWGQLVSRKDKKEVYISGPDDFGVFGPSLKKITVYNPNNDVISDTIDVNSITDMVYLTPKERYLITHSWVNIFVIDLKKRELVKTIELNKEVSNFEKFYLFKQPITKGDTNEDIYIE